MKHLTRRNLVLYVGLAFVAFAAAVFPQPAMAAGKPDFTGLWKVNIEKSNFGPMIAPTSVKQRIDHKDPVIKITTQEIGPDGENNSDYTYSTDGTETISNYRGLEAKTVVNWDGDSLIIETKFEFLGMLNTSRTTLTMAADGKTINATIKISTPQDNTNMSQFLERIDE